MNNFKEKTLSGISWSLLNQIFSQVLTVITTIILARLLSPEDFGIIGLITVITGFANTFIDVGFSSALIQKQEVSQEDLSSVFWFNLLIGFFLTLLFISASPLIAKFYKKEILIPLTILISFNFLIGSVNLVQRTLMLKKVDFKTIFKVNFFTLPITSIITVFLAHERLGVWCIAIQTLLNSTFNAVFLWMMSSWRPSLKFKKDSIKSLFKFSANVFGTESLNYWVRNVDNLLIGKFIGVTELGLYSKAYSFLMLPINNISQVIGRVLFPSLSLIQHDKDHVKRIYLKITRIIALVTFPLMTGLFALSDVFVISIFGPNWTAMIPLVRVFCILGISQSIGTLIGNIYLSQGRSDLLFKIGSYIRFFLILAIVIGLIWGTMGVALSYSIASLLGSYFHYYYAGRLINLKYSEVLLNLSTIFFFSLLMGGIIFIFKYLTMVYLGHLMVLVLSTILGSFLYISFCHFFKIGAFIEVLAVVKERHLKKIA